MSLEKIGDSEYYKDTNETVKLVGYISSSSQRSDESNMYNETFVQIPSSFGQMDILFKPVKDGNYNPGDYESNNDASLAGYLENIEEDEINDGKIFSGLSASAIYDNNDERKYTVEGDEECAEIVLSKNELYKAYSNLPEYDDISETVTLDDLCTDYSIKDTFTFNAVLVYYSIMTPSGKTVIATNAYGILLLNNPIEISQNKYKFPELLKAKSTPTSSGTSFAFRINMKTTSAYNGDVIVVDNSTPSYSMSTDFSDTISNLNKAIDTLKGSASMMQLIITDNSIIKSFAMDAIDKIESMSSNINRILGGNFNEITSESITTGELSAETMVVGSDGMNIQIDIEPDPNEDERENIIGNISPFGLEINNISADYIDASVIDASMMNVITDDVKINTIDTGTEMSRDEALDIISNMSAIISSDGKVSIKKEGDSSVSLLSVIGSLLTLYKNQE